MDPMSLVNLDPWYLFLGLIFSTIGFGMAGPLVARRLGW